MKITGKTAGKIRDSIKRSTMSAANALSNLFSGIHGKTTVRGRRLSATLQANEFTGASRVTWGENKEKTYARTTLIEREETSDSSNIKEDRARKKGNYSSKTSDKNPKNPAQPTQSLPIEAENAARRASAVPVSGNQTSTQSVPAELDPELKALLAVVSDVPDNDAERLLRGGKAKAPAPFTPARPVFSGSEQKLDDVAYRAPMNDSNFDSGIRSHLYQTLTDRRSGPAAPQGELNSVEYRIKSKDGDKFNSACVDVATLKRELGSVSAQRFSEKSSANFALSMVNHLNSSEESPLVPISTENLKVSWAIERNSSGALSASYRILTVDSGVVIEGDIEFSDQAKSIGLPNIQAPFAMWKAGRALAATQLPSVMLVSDETQLQHVAIRVAHVSDVTQPKFVATRIGQEANPIASRGIKLGDDEDLTSLATQGRATRLPAIRGVKLGDDDLTSLATQGGTTRLPPFHGVPFAAHEQALAIDAEEAMAEFNSVPLPGAHASRAAASMPDPALRKPKELPKPSSAREDFMSKMSRLVGRAEPAGSPGNLLPAPLRAGIAKKIAARFVDVVLKDPANRTVAEKAFLAQHEGLVDQFECAGAFGARTRNLRSYLEGARAVQALKISKSALVHNDSLELRLSIPPEFRSNIPSQTDIQAFRTRVQYGTVESWPKEDWGHIKDLALAYEETGRSLIDYMAGVQAEIDKLKAG